MNVSQQLEILEKNCEKIIIDPENTINILDNLLIEIKTPLSIPIYLKVFQSLLPLYKIKIIEDKVKHCNEYLRLKEYDKKILEVYRKFIQLIINRDEYESYKATVELFRSFDHFNYVEKLIIKTLKGTLHPSKAIQDICHQVLSEKLNEPSEISFKILNQMMELKFHPSVLKHTKKISQLSKNSVINSNSINTSIINSNSITNKNLEGKNKNLEGKNIKGRKNIENKKNIEDKTIKDKKNIINKNIESCIRLYLYILRNKEVNFYIETLKVIKYCNLRKDLHEGTLLILNDIINNSNDSMISLYSIIAISSIFSNNNFSLEIATNTLISIINPFSELPSYLISEAVNLLFIKSRQNPNLVISLIKKLMKVSITEYSLLIMNLVSILSQKYKIDIYDNEEQFYCADLFRKIYRI